jgi:hypothetical protein
MDQLKEEFKVARSKSLRNGNSSGSRTVIKNDCKKLTSTTPKLQASHACGSMASFPCKDQKTVQTEHA